jgi:transcriptional antiterminator RfaH
MQLDIEHKSKSKINEISAHTVTHLSQKKWYAIYTRPHHEKKIHNQLQKFGIESYLPLQICLRQWSDRKKKVTEPLFSCYLFVHITLKEYFQVLNTDGVVRYISFEGKAVSIPDNQIQLIKNLLAMDFEITETFDYFERGTRVEIKAGPLIGISGELVDYVGKRRVIIRIDEICKSLWVNVPLKYLKAGYNNLDIAK